MGLGKFILSLMSPEARLLAIAETSVGYLDHFQKVSAEGRFEALLFNAALIGEIRGRDDAYKNFINKLPAEAKKYNYPYGGEIAWAFVASRVSFYREELKNLKDKTYSPINIFTLFYKQPFGEPGTGDVDLISSLSFYPYLVKMIVNVNDQLK